MTDLVSVIEAAYRVGLDETDWLAGIAAAALHPCGQGRGVAVAIDRGGGADARMAGAGLESDRVLDRLELPHAAEILLGEAVDPERLRARIAVPPDVRARASRRQRHRVTRVAAHVATAARLRRRLAPGPTPDPFEGAEAVLALDGRILEARGPAREERARRVLGDAVRAMEWARGHTRRADLDAALAAWRPLEAGRWTVFDRDDAGGRRFAVAHANAPELPAGDRLSPREIQVQTCRDAGLNVDSVAYLLGLSSSTVRTLARRVDAKLGDRTC